MMNSIHLRSIFSACLVPTLINLVGSVFAVDLTVTSHKDDCLVSATQVTLAGTFPANVPNAAVDIKTWSLGPGFGAALAPCAVQQGTWQMQNLPLQPGLNVLRISCGNELMFLRVNVVSPPLPAAQPLRVYLKWPEEPQEDSLKQVLTAIAFSDMDSTDISQWPAVVKRQTKKLLESLYWKAMVPLTIVDAPGAGVQTLQINGVDIPSNLYGVTKGTDYGNLSINECDIYLEEMVDQMKNAPATFHPMNRNDLLVERADNISHFIAYVCAHELGHCLGLVGCDCFNFPQGAWMMGQNRGHNHPFLRDNLRRIAFPDFKELEFRDGNGFELMNDGKDQMPRIYTAHADDPDQVARWIHINSINRGYLKMLYPSDP